MTADNEPGFVRVKRHGAPGYRQGCRCGQCAAGERARKRGAPDPAAAAPSPGRRRRGDMERQTRKLIRSMGLERTPAQQLWIAQAMAGARALDEALASGRPLSAAHRLHDAAIKELEASIRPSPEPEGAVDAEPDDLTLWVAAIHRPSVECQGAYPVVTPGECAACDAAVVARVRYGKRHPDEPGHEYGMSWKQCGCSECTSAAS